MTTADETLYTVALALAFGYTPWMARCVIRQAGGLQQAYDSRADLRALWPECDDRVAATVAAWDSHLERARRELAFVDEHHISILTTDHPSYPQRLLPCSDAPAVLYSLGHADLNARHIISIVGTRRITAYGRQLTERFVNELAALCPDVLIVSGLAYGVDIAAHRQALSQGCPTIGVVAHGLNEIYPSAHRETARQMVASGGLLTEYASGTVIDKQNFVRRNRIVAGMADATILIESADRGGGLITMRLAREYGRQCFAFPGPVGAPYSEGCNRLIQRGMAQMCLDAEDVVKALGWQADTLLTDARRHGIQRLLFPQLSDTEQAIVDAIAKHKEITIEQLAERTRLDMTIVAATTFQLEMKGILRTLAGHTVQLI